MKCPRCSCDFQITAKDLNDEMFCFVVKYQGDFIDAKMAGGVITNMDALLKASANVPAKVMLQSMEQNRGETKFWFLVVPVEDGEP